eukprot:TRINITY_DN1100_c1_g1_i6.p1 TRINITY_DN1100_c1_g1~~TRINITY_DN1100_c1_g1_i6.p1  ORF type:complete len:421 (-),score=31.85 TRINITY_DN1100_c1_g1_i6:90-1352(-)
MKSATNLNLIFQGTIPNIAKGLVVEKESSKALEKPKEDPPVKTIAEENSSTTQEKKKVLAINSGYNLSEINLESKKTKPSTEILKKTMKINEENAEAPVVTQKDVPKEDKKSMIPHNTKEPKKVEDAKENWVFTNIIDETKTVLTLLQRNSSEGSELKERAVFLVEYENGEKHILKTFKYLESNSKDIEFARQEYKVPEKLGSTGHVVRIIKKEELTKDGIIYYLLSTIQSNLIKIIDFGSSLDILSTYERIYNGPLKLKTATWCYLPPEILMGKKEDKVDHFKIDIYCWGMTFYALLSKKNGKVLQKELDEFKMNQKNYYKFLEEVRKIGVDAKTCEFAKLLAKVLSFAPEQRPSFSGIHAQISHLLKPYQRSFHNLPSQFYIHSFSNQCAIVALQLLHILANELLQGSHKLLQGFYIR